MVMASVLEGWMMAANSLSDPASTDNVMSNSFKCIMLSVKALQQSLTDYCNARKQLFT